MTRDTGRLERRKRLTALAAAGVVLGMTGLAAAGWPLYQAFCRATGYAGTPKVDQGGAAGREAAADAPTYTVRFSADVNRDFPWRFEPRQRELRVKPGQPNLAYFEAENRSDRALTGTATFSVTPAKAAQYFVKVDCFCFTRQDLDPGQAREMPVQFYVDPAITEDPDVREVRTLTLSYTFFDKKRSGS